MGELGHDDLGFTFTNRTVDIVTMEDPREVQAYIAWLEESESAVGSDVDRDALLEEARQRLEQLQGNE